MSAACASCGRYTYPRESGRTGYSRNRWVVQQDGALVGTAGAAV